MGEGRWNIRPTPTGIFHSSLFGYLVVEAVGNPSRGNWKGGAGRGEVRVGLMIVTLILSSLSLLNYSALFAVLHYLTYPCMLYPRTKNNWNGWPLLSPSPPAA